MTKYGDSVFHCSLDLIFALAVPDIARSQQPHFWPRSSRPRSASLGARLAIVAMFWPFAAANASETITLKVVSLHGLLGVHHSALARFLTERMAGVGLKEWRFEPAEGDIAASDRVEWDFQTEPVCGGRNTPFQPHVGLPIAGRRPSPHHDRNPPLFTWGVSGPRRKAGRRPRWTERSRSCGSRRERHTKTSRPVGSIPRHRRRAGPSSPRKIARVSLISGPALSCLSAAGSPVMGSPCSNT